MTPSANRPDIDGLRAFAVVPVVLYHFNTWPFSGGYVGVDVFFVISGFLITQLIIRQIREGVFSFRNFYFRRAKRLLPAFFTVVAFVILIGSLILSPEDMNALGWSAVFAVFSASNIHFWSIESYFDTSATMKPLLHTWSLGVEEQFYIIWPAALFLLSKVNRWAAPAALALFAVASLALAQYWLYDNRESTAFYLLPARIVEFAIGAALVWIPPLEAPRHLDEPILAIGLMLIAYPVFFYDHSTIFPGLSALVPCIGAAMAIHSGRARFTGILLRNPIATWIGKTSYSSYLIHWPLVVFYFFLFPGDPGLPEQLILILLTFSFSWVLYNYVEQPVRHGNVRPARTIAAFISIAALLSFVGYSAHAAGGWPWRIPEDRLARARMSPLTQRCAKRNPEVPKSLFRCQIYTKQNRDIILFGDSHAQHYFPGLAREFSSSANIYVAFKGGCTSLEGITDFEWRSIPNKACEKHNKKVIEFLGKKKPSTVVVANANRGDPHVMAAATNDLIARIRSYGHKVVFIGDIVRPNRFLRRCLSVPSYLISDAFIDRNCVGWETHRKRSLDFNRVMAEEVPGYVDASAVQCDGDACRYFLKGRPLFSDDHHLSPFGSEFIVGRLKGHILENDGSASPAPSEAQ